MCRFAAKKPSGMPIKIEKIAAATASSSGRREALADLGEHGLPGRDRRAELELRRLLEVLPVLHVDRLVEPVLMVDLADRLRRRPLAEQRLRGAAGQRPDPDEDEDREPEQDRDEQEQTADDEPEHRA